MVLTDAARLNDATAFGRGWQLSYSVVNFAPAAQLVVVEQQRADDSWETVQACHTIEFQARGARRRGGLTRIHGAPINWDGQASTFPRLRLALRGIGQVQLTNVELGNGPTTLRFTLKRKILGRTAPSRGFPDLDWTRNQDVIRLTLSQLSGRKTSRRRNQNHSR
jgi:hypothetical protein